MINVLITINFSLLIRQLETLMKSKYLGVSLGLPPLSNIYIYIYIYPLNEALVYMLILFQHEENYLSRMLEVFLIICRTTI